MVDVRVRPATASDLVSILGIYNHVIANTTAVYIEAPTDLGERTRWFEARISAGWPVLVADRAGEVLGFGSYGPFRLPPCYRDTVEHTVHIHPDARGQGVGRLIVSALIDRAKQAGLHVMVAGIDADNGASIALHKRLGFSEAGVLREVGFKFSRRLDLSFWTKVL